MIKGPHTCVMPTISQDHNKMELKLVGKNILAMVEENEQLTFLHSSHSLDKSLDRPSHIVYGNWEESYNILPKYLQALQLFVPSTIVRIQTIPALDESNQPIPNKACIDAFAFCKPIVQIDGTWLYGRYKGMLLIAFT
ncbi:hypothetical protein GmHk_18G052564 [Glycine max]|nr:hypothetical protein GmHk_18G052564 [Glycine max]